MHASIPDRFYRLLVRIETHYNNLRLLTPAGSDRINSTERHQITGSKNRIKIGIGLKYVFKNIIAQTPFPVGCLRGHDGHSFNFRNPIQKTPLAGIGCLMSRYPFQDRSEEHTSELQS